MIPHTASSRTWYIKADGTGDAPTIQAGVDSAAVGDTVMVAPGVYSDTLHVSVEEVVRAVNVYLKKNVILMGDQSLDRPIIDGVNSYVGIYAQDIDSTASVSHFELRRLESFPIGCPDLSAKSSEGIVEYSARIRCLSSSIVLSDNYIHGDEVGIHLRSASPRVDGNLLLDVGNGVRCEQGSNPRIFRNMIYNCFDGVFCKDSAAFIADNVLGAPPPVLGCNGIRSLNSSACITGNRIVYWQYGIRAGVSSVIIDNNLMEYNAFGIWVSACDAMINSNVFHQGVVGIDAFNTRGQIMNNTIDDHTSTGILCEAGADPLVRGNIISRVAWGVECVGALPIFQCNDIYEASSGLYVGECAGQNGINGNFSADAEYCGIDDSGNYFLQSDSPCAPGNHPGGVECGLIGALGVNCGTVQCGSPWRKRYRCVRGVDCVF